MSVGRRVATLTVVAIILALLGFIGVQIVRGVMLGGVAEPKQDTVADCFASGVAFYKEAGSFPYLKSEALKGTRVEDHVRAMCQRNPSAFSSYRK